MGDDRSCSFPTDRRHTRRWGSLLPQRSFLVVLLCAPLIVHAQGTEAPPAPMPAMPPGHMMMHGGAMMPGGAHDSGSMPANGGDDTTKPSATHGAPNPHAPADAPTQSQQSFVPSVTGPRLAPSIPEEQANRQFGVDKTLQDARANTSVVYQSLPVPVDLAITFTGPLWTVKKDKLQVTVRGYGTVEINEDTLHDAIVTQSGVVRSLYAFPGMEVKAGDPLISVYSPERVNAQHMLLADFSKDEGNQISLQYFSSFSSTQKYLEQSRSNLKWWGFSDADIDALLKTGQIKEDYVFQADQDDYVVEAEKSPGAVVVAGDKSEENFVIPGEQIMRMASLNSVWGMSFVNPEADAGFKLGDAIHVTVGEGRQQKSLQGLIVHKHDTADPTTRKTDFHILLENPDRGVAPGNLIEFGKETDVDGLWIPTAALLSVRGQPTVIRRNSRGYEAVRVAVGPASGDLSQVLGGLSEGDQVVAAPRAELNPDTRVHGLMSWE